MSNILNSNSLINYILQEVKKHEHAILLHTGTFQVPGPSHFEVLSGWNALDLMNLEDQDSFTQIDEFLDRGRQRQHVWRLRA